MSGYSTNERNRKSPRLPFLSQNFLKSLDESQKRLMNLADFAFSDIAGLLELRDPIAALIEQFKFEAPILFSLTQEENFLQESVS